MKFEGRRYIILLIFIAVGLLFIFRLFFVQIIDKRWDIRAKDISEDISIVYPARGYMFDRNGKLLVSEEAVYDLHVTPKSVGEIDTLAFCELVGIDKESFIKKIKVASEYPNVPYKASVFIKQIPADEFASISEELHKYNGFKKIPRSLRSYPDSAAAHVVGYIREIDKQTLDEKPYYRMGDFIGIKGLEKYYEEVLRGQKGERIYLKDTYGNEIKDIKVDTAISGDNIYTTIDLDLQKYAERLMKNKIGSVVAIEPATGEILAMVSSPEYDPNQFVGRKFGENYGKLLNDSLRPLVNRPLTAYYPPGSIFKLIQSLICLQEGVVTESTSFPCNKSLVNCHNHPTAQSVSDAIKFSCNPYFYSAVKRFIQSGEEKSIFRDAAKGLEKWNLMVKSFGLGQIYPTDFPESNMKPGLVPSVQMYNTIYGEYRWAYSTIYSISIGQGEVVVTPLQMANIATIIANRGYYYYPHFVKKIGEIGDKLPRFKEKNFTMVNEEYFTPVVNAMQRVVEEPGGTARLARADSITICGKTGTAQNPHGEDHSVFIAFAPKDNPQIAVSVYVENAGFGGVWAAPIASLVIEKYLRGYIKDERKEKRILEKDFIHAEGE